MLSSKDANTRARGSGMDHGLAHRGQDRRGAGEVRRFAADRDSHMRMAKNARRGYEELFSRERFFDRLKELLEQV